MPARIGSSFSLRSTLAIAAIALIVTCAHEVAEPPTVALAQPAVAFEIHCKHFFYGCPVGTQESNDVIIHDIYALSSNDSTKFADWVAYRLDHVTVFGDVTTSRNWKADPWLDADETLEPDDYTEAYATLEMDRGHQAPLASFKGTNCWYETNYLSNITPQKSDLNQGPWQRLEGKVRDLVGAGSIVYVITGPLYERDMPSLPQADETHRVPSGYWKIITVEADSIRCASFVFDQDTPRDADILDHLSTIDGVEALSGLDFLCELPDSTEAMVESNAFQSWVTTNFR